MQCYLTVGIQCYLTVGVHCYLTAGVTETGHGDCGCDGDRGLGDCVCDRATGLAVVASLSAIVLPGAAVPSQVKTKHYTGTNQHTGELISTRNT